MAAGVGVKVHGLRELNRAFKAVAGDLDKKLIEELKEAAEPVAKETEQLALTRIRNMPSSPQWAVMRIFVSKANATVSMFPLQRGRRNRGAGLGPRLQEAMDIGLEHNENEVHNRIDGLIGRIADHHGF
jgi:hypothetical protein